ncbi:hypothetical protein HMPREF1306_05397 [Klebsiella pneumoniae subsp. pneumoniae WGLW2]|uniref:hypothetical protein n=1 Tax=Klebsiella pneumoniae TaxID=573 RepID=UPI0002831206|nr:hypothetical protein [Klebsiella pneumoniae]EKB69953.1 hypothetical protein HMPREF1306_05397 [Klebsiella pneumoniae subsp. pneumoniae WGLW2]
MTHSLQLIHSIPDAVCVITREATRVSSLRDKRDNLITQQFSVTVWGVERAVWKCFAHFSLCLLEHAR